MRKRVVTMAVAGAFALLLTGSGFPADQMGSGRGEAHARQRGRKVWFQRKKVKQAMKLTQQQIAALEEEQQVYRGRIVELRKAERKAYAAVVEALGAEKPDPGAVAKARQELEKAALALDRAIMDHWEAMRRILTVEQWNRLPEVAPRALRFGGAVALRGRGTIRTGTVEAKGSGK